jgi:NAD(P)-dependent dehydrogenase (short-subunit alcohol dehydrogenase family)
MGRRQRYVGKHPVVVITGAGSGIGRATARAFGRRGARLVLGDIDEEAVERVATELREGGADSVGMRCDVRNGDDVDALVERAVELFGRIDVMVNNAGVGHYGRVEDTSVEEFAALLDVNVLGVQRGLRAVVPRMRAHGSGHIVVVGSVNGTIGWPYHGAYAATKGALKVLTQSLRMELADSGVTATLVLPANVRTEFYRDAGISSPWYRPRPLGRSTTPGSVARLIVRSVRRPSAEVNRVRSFRVASVLAEAAPAVADWAGKRFYRSVSRDRLGGDSQ